MAVGSGVVDQFMAALEHPLKAEIERLRAIIIGANAGISEQIKWKAPSFCYRGDDRVTMKPQPMNQIQLIFHRGARPNDTADFAFKDNSGLLDMGRQRSRRGHLPKHGGDRDEWSSARRPRQPLGHRHQ